VKEISVIIPAYNEEKNIPVLIQKFKEFLEKNPLNLEVIIVDDGSTDKTYEIAKNLEKEVNFLKVIKHRANMGKTEAILTGFEKAEGKYIVIMDADLQYLPESITKLYSKIKEGFDIVTGWKRGKYEKKFVSSVYNWLSRKLFNLPIHDQNAIKILKREILENIFLRKDWHRYIVALACEQGYKAGEVEVELHPRLYGESKYRGFKRVIIGLLDLIAVKFQTSFMKKPMLLFGSFGGALTLAGILVAIYAFYMRFVKGIGYRPLLYLVMLLIIVGIVLFVMGFLAEAISGLAERVDRLERRLTK